MAFQNNGAPQGYGQQRGRSPYLDNPEDEMGGDERSQRASDRGAPSAPSLPPRQQALEQGGGQPQNQTQPAGPPQAATGWGPQARAPQPPQGGQQPAWGNPNPAARPPAGNYNGVGGENIIPPRNTGVTGGNSYGGPQQNGAPGAPPPAGRVPGQENYGFGQNADGSSALGPNGSPALPPSTNPASGATSMGDPRSAASRAAAANGWTDIAGAETLTAGAHVGALEGFNTGGWGSGERGSNTHKNTFGKLASRYDPMDPQSTQKLMADPDFMAFFPDAKLIEHPNADMIDFGDGKPVDVKRASVNGASPAWQWGVDAGGAGAPGGAPGGPGAPPGAPGANGLGQDPALAAQLMAALQGGGDGGTSIEQLMAMLGIGGAQQSSPSPGAF